MDTKFQVGDHVRIVNYLATKRMPVGIVERIDGAYHYVWVDMPDAPMIDRCIYEVYHNELVKITEQEYFKLILAGTNLDD